MLKTVISKVNQLVFAFSLKGVVLIGLAIAVIYNPEIIVWIVVAVLLVVGFASLYIAAKINGLKKAVASKIPKFLK